MLEGRYANDGIEAAGWERQRPDIRLMGSGARDVSGQEIHDVEVKVTGCKRK
jgi:hypothetical protein